MFVFLSKFLPPFLYPIGLCCILIVAALLLRRRQKLQTAILLLALALLVLGGNTYIAAAITRSLEWQYLPPAGEAKADAIVVLGGGTEPAQYPRQIVEVNGAGDRVLYAAWLYHQGRAPYLLLSGGNIDWIGYSGSTPAQEMALLLQMLDVPQAAMWLQQDSQNTYEDALYSSRMLAEKGIHRILLVTSAYHMPRAVALFRRQGLEVIPAPTDYTITEQGWQNLLHGDWQYRLVSLIPNASSLGLTSRAIKEYLGILVYRLQGWL